ncbi:RagB/SusD family nutrient uptake outer membrane protein [Ancylomarina sp. 16SWW S1-10-2]|uniref:RagB/SusD family nutrient uptake outer membrane protein n=1 Tax=Ancylomarina sp. 16SWW S1-10-2 TaxID=2499681 RepID=UPI0012ADA83A|nr:RagB/SusD family nutrient uptake outer membrane protein [Ancylomarina sp. 16SWW S1-10-2]MRT91621.1 RagB/SusD family nutrient uptake outer membrane protein [Ancylomarina sp. 16SWW S1-10-2]
MKRIAYIYIILAALLVSGCEDFLSFDPLTQKTSANYPANAEEAKQMIAGIYTTMNNEHQVADGSYLFANIVASDEILGGGGVNDIKPQAFEAFMYSDLDMLGHNWETTYEGIHRANYAIENLPEMDEAVLTAAMRNQYLGEAYFLRAFFYHRLATLYGSVPLKITTEVVDLPGASAEEIFAQIASDLKMAIEIMPETPYTDIEQGHATRWAAQAMMARVWLFYTGFYQNTDLPLVEGGSVSKQNVIDYLTDCVGHSGHKLVGDFHELWPYTNSLTIGDYDYIQDYMADTGKKLVYASDNGARNPETMFALQFNNFANWDIRRGYSNTYQLYFALRGLQSVDKTFPFAGGWGQANSIPKQWVDQWMVDEPNDPRIGASVMDIAAELPNYAVGQWDFVLESNYWGKKYNGISAKNPETGEAVHDYSVLMYGNQNNNQLSHGDDLVFIRFADVLLMLSELTGDAQYMNEVRDRADLPPVTYSLENLQKERRHELAFEGLRYNDMRRWGATYTKAALETQVGTPVLNFGKPAVFNGLNPKGYSARYDETKGFFPIPQSQIDLSKGLLEQVEGYRNGEGLYSGWSN